MISWRVIGIGGWAGWRLLEFQLRKHVGDLSDDKEQQVRVADLLGCAVSSPLRVRYGENLGMGCGDEWLEIGNDIKDSPHLMLYIDPRE